MRSHLYLIPVWALGILSAGCASDIYREFTIDGKEPTSVSLDARQRVVLVTNKGGKNSDKHVVCAEPSPDALSAFAAAAAASGTLGTGQKIELSSEFAEQVAAMTPRTQTIQLLRDGLFRACEAYMNGIIDWREYKPIVANYDQVMLTALALDGLTQHTVRLAEPLNPRATATVGDETASAGTTTPGGAPGVSGDGSTQNVISKDVADAVRNILKDYYELQLKLAEIEARSSNKSQTPVVSSSGTASSN